MSEHTHDHGHDHGHPHPNQPDIDSRAHGLLPDHGQCSGRTPHRKGCDHGGRIAGRHRDCRQPDAPKVVLRLLPRPGPIPTTRVGCWKDGTAAVDELGIDMPATHLVVVENTETVHNVIVCTLCSCYPRMLLGLPPDWYKAHAYRSRVLSGNPARFSRNSAPNCPMTWRSGCMIRRRTCVTWCSRGVRKARQA